VALAQSGRQAIAISCDLRNPTLHRFLDGDNDVGLTDLLLGLDALGEALQETDTPGLFLIASGAMPDNPTDLLGSEQMGRLLASLRTTFDFVLLDAGPGLVADVLFLAPHVDGVIVVADAAKTSHGAVAHLRHQLEDVGALVIGGILNNWAPRHAGRPYPYYLRSDPGSPSSAGSAEAHAEVDGEEARADLSTLPPAQSDGDGSVPHHLGSPEAEAEA
jgi:receptor protein-tyrosine kinase